MYVLRNIMRVLELGRTNMTGRCRAPILKPSLFALTALRFCLPSPKTLASVLHSQGFSFSSSLLQWPLFFSDTPLPLLAASSPQPLKSTLPYLVLLSLLPMTPPPPPFILSQNFLILDLFCNFEYFRFALSMTQIKLQLDQQTLKYLIIFYATKITFYAIFNLQTR